MIHLSVDHKIQEKTIQGIITIMFIVVYCVYVDTV